MAIPKMLKRILHYIIFISILILPFFVVAKMPDSPQFRKIAETFSMTSGDLLSCVIDYVSLVVALLLGLVAYQQTQAINDLEYSKYNVFVGVEKLDYSLNYGQPFEWTKLGNSVSSLQSVSYETKTLISYLNMVPKTEVIGNGKLIQIPLVLTAKNEPLIVSISTHKISVEIFNGNELVSKKVFKDKGPAYHALVHDGEQFNVCLGIILQDTVELSGIQLKLDVVLEDHIGRKHKMQLNTTLSRQSNGLFLTSSHTKRLAY